MGGRNRGRERCRAGDPPRESEVSELDAGEQAWNAHAGSDGTTCVSRPGCGTRRAGERRLSARPRCELTAHVDGGARGNPGPAAVAVVIQRPTGEVLEERRERIGEATNNVAEYRAVLLGIERARELGADEVELVGDSELIVRQVRGEYKVKDAGLRPLHARVREELESFDGWSIRHVRREHNAEADRLVNEALDEGS